MSLLPGQSLREDKIVVPLDLWLDHLFSPARRGETVNLLRGGGDDASRKTRRDVLRRSWPLVR